MKGRVKKLAERFQSPANSATERVTSPVISPSQNSIITCRPLNSAGNSPRQSATSASPNIPVSKHLSRYKNIASDNADENTACTSFARQHVIVHRRTEKPSTSFETEPQSLISSNRPKNQAAFIHDKSKSPHHRDHSNEAHPKSSTNGEPCEDDSGLIQSREESQTKAVKSRVSSWSSTLNKMIRSSASTTPSVSETKSPSLQAQNARGFSDLQQSSVAELKEYFKNRTVVSLHQSESSSPTFVKSSNSSSILQTSMINLPSEHFNERYVDADTTHQYSNRVDEPKIKPESLSAVAAIETPSADMLAQSAHVVDDTDSDASGTSERPTVKRSAILIIYKY